MSNDLNDEQRERIQVDSNGERLDPDREREPVAAEEPVPPFPPAGVPAKVKKRPSFLARAARWLLVFLIVFGLGALLVIFLLYLPARQEADVLRAEIETANQRVTQLESQVESLENLGTTNETLQSEVEQMEVYNTLVSARADILTAQLALARDEPDRARLALSNTPDKLAELNSALAPNQQPMVDNMLNRLTLAQEELEDDVFAAQSDLDVLANSLIEMENTLFANP